MSTKSTWAVAWAVGLLSWVLAACGPKADYPAESPAAYPGAAPAPPPAERQLETVEDASSALDEDELRLDQLLRQPVPAAQAGLHACQRVCAALGSMARSVDAICELAGQDDHRCARARQRLETNTRRVAGAGCAC